MGVINVQGAAKEYKVLRSKRKIVIVNLTRQICPHLLSDNSYICIVEKNT